MRSVGGSCGLARWGIAGSLAVLEKDVVQVGLHRVENICGEVVFHLLQDISERFGVCGLVHKSLCSFPQFPDIVGEYILFQNFCDVPLCNLW